MNYETYGLVQVNELVQQSGYNNRVIILNLSVLTFIFQLFQMRVRSVPLAVRNI